MTERKTAPKKDSKGVLNKVFQRSMLVDSRSFHPSRWYFDVQRAHALGIQSYLLRLGDVFDTVM